MFSQAKQSLSAVFTATVRDELKYLWRKQQTQWRSAEQPARRREQTTAWEKYCKRQREDTEQENWGGNISATQVPCTLMQKQKLQQWNMFNYFTVHLSAVCVERTSNEMQAKPKLDGAVSTWSYIRWSTIFRSITNLPFLSLGELRKNGTCAEATLLPLRVAGKIGRKERGLQENQDAECEKR